MFRVPQPLESISSVHPLCASTIRDLNVRAAIAGLGGALQAAEDLYLATAPHSLHTIVPGGSLVGSHGTVDHTRMVWLYDVRFVAGPAREIYDKLRALAPHDICPLCGHNHVSTLDHVLPKTAYPAYTVTPINLVPSCMDCNVAKRTSQPANAHSNPIHPYFDDLDGDVWLVAEFVDQSPTVTFSVNPPASWSVDLKARVLNQFKILNLSRLYASNASSELSQQSEALRRVFDRGGPVDVATFLGDQCASREAYRRNSWQSALYRCWASSPFFCNEGWVLRP